MQVPRLSAPTMRIRVCAALTFSPIRTAGTVGHLPPTFIFESRITGQLACDLFDDAFELGAVPGLRLYMAFFHIPDGVDLWIERLQACDHSLRPGPLFAPRASSSCRLLDLAGVLFEHAFCLQAAVAADAACFLFDFA
jgi:hypothetical protein